MVICDVGELFGVDYLYSQTGKVLRMAVPEPDEAAEEDQLVEDMPLDEGFVEVSDDVDDLTVNIIEEALHDTATLSTAPTAAPVAELPTEPSAALAEPIVTEQSDIKVDEPVAEPSHVSTLIFAYKMFVRCVCE